MLNFVAYLHWKYVHLGLSWLFQSNDFDFGQGFGSNNWNESQKQHNQESANTFQGTTPLFIASMLSYFKVSWDVHHAAINYWKLGMGEFNSLAV